MEEKKTGCECPLAGYCNRHGIKKNHHYHKLCQNHTGYFKMWEECRGPGQNFIDCDKKEEKTDKEVKKSQEEAKLPEVSKCVFCNNEGCNGQCRNNQALPSKTQMLKNFASATKDHVQNGMVKAENDLQQQRLDICKGCEFYIPEQDRCGKCGCYLKSKSAWKSAKCPIGKWVILFCLLLV